MFRALRVIATGQWCGPMIEDGHLADDGKVWADNVALTLGLRPGALAVVDGDTDPRTGVTLDDPNVTEPEPAPAPSKLDTLIEAIANAKDIGELKAAAVALKV